MASGRGERWPSMPVSGWQPTRDTLQLSTQVVGKVRLANGRRRRLGPRRPRTIEGLTQLSRRATAEISTNWGGRARSTTPTRVLVGR
jgi:Family of unknown function (DUF5996)